MRNPIMVGERLYLRALEPEDADALARASAAETETFMERGRMPQSSIRFGAYFGDMYKQQPPDDISFAVCRRDDDACIGMVDLFEVDYVNRTAETGAWLLEAGLRGQGYGPEAKHLLLEYAFDRLGLHALRSWVFELNTRSAAAVQRQGYRLAGRVKWDDVKDGVFRDALVFDVLRDEWLAARDEWLAARDEWLAARDAWRARQGEEDARPGA